MAVAEILSREGQWDPGRLQTRHVRPAAADGFTFLRTLLGFPFPFESQHLYNELQDFSKWAPYAHSLAVAYSLISLAYMKRPGGGGLLVPSSGEPALAMKAQNMTTFQHN